MTPVTALKMRSMLNQTQEIASRTIVRYTDLQLEGLPARHRRDIAVIHQKIKDLEERLTQ